MLPNMFKYLQKEVEFRHIWSHCSQYPFKRLDFDAGTQPICTSKYPLLGLLALWVLTLTVTAEARISTSANQCDQIKIAKCL